MKRIVIIDDMFRDIDLINSHTEKVYEVTDNYEVVEKEMEVIEQTPFYSHADICAKIIKKYCGNVKFINIVIKESFQNGNVKKLIKAIEYSGLLHADVVHMSVGTTHHYHVYRMHKAIKKLSRQTKIVAAHANNGKKTFPADFVEVAGCKSSPNTQIQNLKKNNYALSGVHLIRVKDAKLIYTTASNSFAAAYYTGLYCSSRI